MKFPGKVLFESLRHLFIKPATVDYPHSPAQVAPNFRGQIVFNANNCIGCLACMRDCPARAIEIRRVGEKKERRFECDFYLDRCIYCAQCVDSCGKNLALSSTNTFELAQLTREKLKVHYDAKPPEEQPAVEKKSDDE